MSHSLTRPRALWLMLGLLAIAGVLLVLAVPPAQAATLHAHALHFSPLAFAGVALGTGAVAEGGQFFQGVLPSALAARGKRGFFAPLRWAPINAGVTTAVQLQADVNHDIIISRMAYTARDAATLALVDRPPLFAEISLVSGILFTPGQGLTVELENIAGVNRGAPELLIPIIIPAGEIFSVRLTNGTAATNLNVQLDLIGARAAINSR